MPHGTPPLMARLATAALALVAATVMMTSTASADIVDRIVAQVNDEIITLYELEQAAVPYLAQHGRDPGVLDDPTRREQVLEEVLDDQIDTLLVEEEAAELGLEVTEDQLREWISMTAREQGMTEQQFRQLIAQQGIDEQQYHEMIRDNLLRMQLVQHQGRGGTVSEAEIDQEYRERFGDPDEPEETIEIRHILLVPEQMDGDIEQTRQKAEELREKIIEEEASFEQLAERYSEGPGADDGGNIGTVGRGELAESFERAAFDQELGEVSRPVETEFGIHLIEVLDRSERLAPQVEQRREQIRAQLQQQEMERQMDSYLETLRTRAFVDVRY